MASVKEKSLALALNAAGGFRQLPTEYDPNSQQTWIKAIGLVKKVDGTENYVLLENDGLGESRIVRDYGNPVICVSITNIYPYLMLDRSVLPYLKDDNERVTYLTRNGFSYEQATSMLLNDRNKMQRAIIKVAVENAKLKAKEYKHRKYVKSENNTTTNTTKNGKRRTKKANTEIDF
jgi:hypothetical protein